MSEDKEGLSVPETYNILDYIAWRGDLSFLQDPFNPVDSLIFSIFSYEDLGKDAQSDQGIPIRMIVPGGKTVPQSTPLGRGDRENMISRMASARRFRDILVYDQFSVTDPARDIQFSAVTLNMPNCGTLIAFRGTDGSPVGWKEDFMMSYECPVPAQSAALEYLTRAARRTVGPLYLTGHSKGGNLALYSASMAPPEIQDRLVHIASFDGPGLSDEVIASPGYARIRDRIYSAIPHGSIVGMLMNYHPDFTIVQSTTLGGILQHNGFTWRVMGNAFVEAQETSRSSQMLDQSVHEWLKQCTPEQRRIFVQAIFSLPNSENQDTDENRHSRIMNMLNGASMLKDPQIRKLVTSLIGRFLAIYSDNCRKNMGIGSLSSVTGALEKLRGGDKA